VFSFDSATSLTITMACQWNLYIMIVNSCVTQIVVGETRPQVNVRAGQNRKLEEFNLFNDLKDNPNEEAIDDLDRSLIKNHVSGGLPMISDSMFSLVILIYVSAAFCFVFFMFCWSNESDGGRDTGIKHQCILMANNIAKRGGIGIGHLPPTETEASAASATTAGAAASVTLKRALSMSAEVTASSAAAAAAAADATGIPLLTTDDDGGAGAQFN